MIACEPGPLHFGPGSRGKITWLQFTTFSSGANLQCFAGMPLEMSSPRNHSIPPGREGTMTRFVSGVTGLIGGIALVVAGSAIDLHAQRGAGAGAGRPATAGVNHGGEQHG